MCQARHERNTPRTHHDFELSEVLSALRSDESGDLARPMVTLLYQVLIDAEATEVVQAGRHERTIARTDQRNGFRARLLTTSAGDVELTIPKLRKGSFSFRACSSAGVASTRPSTRSSWRLDNHGVSTRTVDDLVIALGVDAGITTSEVSRICSALDVEIDEFRERSRAVVFAPGAAEDASREVLGIAIGDSEDAAFWSEFLQSLRERGPCGVQLVISDSHLGLMAAIAQVFPGASWQRCHVHCMRNVLAKVTQSHQQMVAAMVQTIFCARRDPRRAPGEISPDLDEKAILRDHRHTARRRRGHHRLSSLPEQPLAKDLVDLFARTTERRNQAPHECREICPNDATALRLITAVIVEQHDEWSVSERRYLSQESMDLLKEPALNPAPVALAKVR